MPCRLQPPSHDVARCRASLQLGQPTDASAEYIATSIATGTVKVSSTISSRTSPLAQTARAALSSLDVARGCRQRRSRECQRITADASCSAPIHFFLAASLPIPPARRSNEPSLRVRLLSCASRLAGRPCPDLHSLARPSKQRAIAKTRQRSSCAGQWRWASRLY
jgi:hypothetical protein